MQKDDGYGPFKIGHKLLCLDKPNGSSRNKPPSEIYLREKQQPSSPARLTVLDKPTLSGLINVRQLMHKEGRPDLVVLPALAVFAIMGVGNAVAGFRSYAFYKRASRWPFTRGLITESKKVRGYRGVEELSISYEYFLPERHTGNRISPAKSGFFSSARQNEYFAQYQVGTEVDVYYDSADPDKSCLNPRETSGIKGLFTLAGFMMLPGIGYLFMNYILK